MSDAVFVSTARTPIGRAQRGAFNDTTGVDLVAPLLMCLLERSRLEVADVEEITMGCGYPEGATGGTSAALPRCARDFQRPAPPSS